MSVQQDMLVEYDPQTRAAIGLVALDVKDCKVCFLHCLFFFVYLKQLIEKGHLLNLCLCR